MEYIADKALEVRIHAERDEEGRFVELRGNGLGIGLPGYVYDENRDPIYQFADFNPEVYILENGDVAMEIKYYKTDEPEKIIEETIIFDHKKY